MITKNKICLLIVLCRLWFKLKIQIWCDSTVLWLFGYKL